MTHASLKKYLLLLAFYLILALVLTYPLALNLTTHIPGHDTDGPAQTWSLWWTRFALLDLGRAPFTTDYLFYPLGLNLVAYTPVFANGILSIPLQLAFGVVPAQNLMVLFALVSGAFGAYLLARRALIRGGMDNSTALELGAAAGGALYGFGAWHLNYVVAGHFMLISNQWLPYYAFSLLALDRVPAASKGGGRAALGAGAWLGFWLILTAWTELTYLPFLALLTLFYLGYVLLAHRTAFVSGLAALVVAAVIALVGISPLLASLAADFQRYGYYLMAGVGRIQIFSAEVISFFLPSSQHPVLGAWSESITTANTSYAFVGWAALALAGVGLYVKRASALARWFAVAAALFALLMFGSTLYWNGKNTNIPMPFALLRLIPFVNANRYPARFNVMLMLALVPLVAWGVAALWGTDRASGRRAAWGRLALAGLALLLVFEQLVLPIPLTDVRVPSALAALANDADDYAVLELPLGWRGSIVMQGKTDDVAQFFQTVDHKRRLGGITSRFPDFKLRYFAELPVIGSLIALEEGRAVRDEQLARDKAVVGDVLRFFEIRDVLLNRAELSPETQAYVDAVLPLDPVSTAGGRALYRVRLEPLPAQAKFDPSADVARMLFDDGWGRAQEDNAGAGYRWAQDGAARVLVPLEPADYAFTFRLRGAHPEQRVELRVNGQPVVQWVIRETWGEYSAHVPAALVKRGLNEFVFATDLTPLADASPDDRTIGGTGVVSPVDLAVTGAGFDSGKFGEIVVNGHNQIPDTRGYHLVAVNPQTGAVDAVGAFDTFGDADASRRLAEFVTALPAGEIVAGAAIDDAAQELTNEGYAALQMLGVSADVRSQFRAGHAFVGIKGLAPGQAVEDLNVTLPANIAIGKNVNRDRVALALGAFEYERQ